MQGEPRVSVVSAVRNGERYLSEALESVMGQTLPPDEVLVIDDGSTDATADIARSYGARVMPSRGRGVSDARNTGIAECRGDLIAFIDHDDVWEPHKLERQVAHLETHPEVGYVLCWLRVVIEPGFERPAWVKDEDLTRGYLAHGPSLFVRRGAFETVGLFTSGLAIGEDADWIVRAQEAGVPCGVVAEPLIRYRLHGENATGDGSVNAHAVMHVLRLAVVRKRAAAPAGKGRGAR